MLDENSRQIKRAFKAEYQCHWWKKLKNNYFYAGWQKNAEELNKFCSSAVQSSPSSRGRKLKARLFFTFAT